MSRALKGHLCNAYCGDVLHCDLIYTGMTSHVAIAKWVSQALRADVLRIKAAHEAQALEAIPETRRQVLVGAEPRDGNRYLVWWHETQAKWVPPSTAELRARGIGQEEKSC